MDHSVAVGAYARRIALQNRAEERFANDAFTGGILHDAGKLILAAGCPKKYKHVLSAGSVGTEAVEQIERDILGATHAEVGGYLLGLWGFPDPIVEAVAYHHHPSRCVARGLTPLAVVHASNYLAHLNVAGAEDNVTATLDRDYCNRANLKVSIRTATDCAITRDDAPT